jgi:glycosyltransferase involved in cell wall biosynthesis
MRIVIVTDAWLPQTNGVVTTLQQTVRQLRDFGHEVHLVTPEGFKTVPCPTYPEIRLALFSWREVGRRLRAIQPDAVHIATEGPLGLAARQYAVSRGLAFTTSYHTQFPQYISARLPIPAATVYRYLRCFHSRSSRVMVGTEEMRRELRMNGFRRVVPWTRGVDTERFTPAPVVTRKPIPTLLYVGRVAVEKSVRDFCDLTVTARKVVVGDGPGLAELKCRYPSVEFRGFQHGTALVASYQEADCFVFPSRTDTFGLVMLEAMACGLPVAAYPVTGPIDVVRPGVTGCLSENLDDAVNGALTLNPASCRQQALEYNWERAARQFEGHLVPFASAPKRREIRRRGAHRVRAGNSAARP